MIEIIRSSECRQSKSNEIQRRIVEERGQSRETRSRNETHNSTGSRPRVTHAWTLFKSQMMRCFWPDSLPLLLPSHTSPNEINFLLGRLSYATRIASTSSGLVIHFPASSPRIYSSSRPPRVFLHSRLGEGCCSLFRPNKGWNCSPAATARYRFPSYTSSSSFKSSSLKRSIYLNFPQENCIQFERYVRWK